MTPVTPQATKEGPSNEIDGPKEWCGCQDSNPEPSGP